MSYNGVIAVISDSSNTIIANVTQSVTGIVDDSAKSEIFAVQAQRKAPHMLTLYQPRQTPSPILYQSAAPPIT